MGKKKSKPSNTKSEATARDVLASLERLHRFMRAACHTEGLNPAQWDSLRYLSRCNQFSNSPSALSHYLGTTRGTVSQTLVSLEKRGLVRKQAGADGHRSVAVYLTEQAAIVLLAQDPLQRFASDIEGLGGKTKRKFSKGVRSLLQTEIARNGGSHFGSCTSCRHYKAADSVQDETGPAQAEMAADTPAGTGASEASAGRCSYFKAALAAGDISAICQMYQRA